MIIEQSGLIGMTSDLEHLDESADKLGFVRWQWEYNRATYDLKLQDRANGDDYYLRVNARAIEGRLESPYAILSIESVYIGKAARPQGVDYDAPIPAPILDTAKQRLEELKSLLA